MDSSNTPNHRNGIPSPPTFAGSVDGNFHWLETILWPLRVIYTYMEENGTDPPHLSAPYPSVWSEIWKRKHLESVLDSLAISIL